MNTLKSMFVVAVSAVFASCVLAAAPPIQTPTVINPTVLEFPASPDHDVTVTVPTTSGGTEVKNLVTGYRVAIKTGTVDARPPVVVAKGSTTVTNGRISVPLTQTDLKQNTPYTAVVTIIGDGGEAAYPASGPFVWGESVRPPRVGAGSVIVR